MNVASRKPLRGEIRARVSLGDDRDINEPRTAIERAREQFQIMMARRRGQKSIARD